jgi:hypothetical protein
MDKLSKADSNSYERLQSEERHRSYEPYNPDYAWYNLTWTRTNLSNRHSGPEWYCPIYAGRRSSSGGETYG